MTIKVLIEGILVLVFGLVAMAEGLRLIIHKDPYVLYDPLGPGFYVLALSVALMVAGVIHLVGNRGNNHGKEKTTVSREMRIRLFGSFLVLALYIFLIGFAGYITATVLFCLLEFRIAGVTSWRANLILTLAVTGVYYVLFVTLCEMVFPSGILF